MRPDKLTRKPLTIWIEPSLKLDLKIIAAKENRTMREMIERILEDYCITWHGNEEK